MIPWREWRAIREKVLTQWGLKRGGHYPKDGCPAIEVDGVQFRVLPATEPELVEKLVRNEEDYGWTTELRPKKGSKHRFEYSCPHCGCWLSAGRQHQHRCKQEDNG